MTALLPAPDSEAQPVSGAQTKQASAPLPVNHTHLGVENEGEIISGGDRTPDGVHSGDRTELSGVAVGNPETEEINSDKTDVEIRNDDVLPAAVRAGNSDGDRVGDRTERRRRSGDYSEAALSAELRQLGAAPELDVKQSPHVGIATSPLQAKDLRQSPRVGIEPAGRKPKQRNDQPPHVPRCEWRASNKRTDGELSWRLLAVIEWLDPVGEKKKKTQHVGYLPASAWGLIRKFDYETRRKLVEKEIGAKARASRESLEAYRDEAIRLSNVGIGSPSGRTIAD